MRASSWTLWAARLLLSAAAPWWFSLAERPSGISGAACSLLALAATVYGGLWWALSLGTALCLLLARGTGRLATHASVTARRGLRVLGLSALLGVLATPLAAASQGTHAASTVTAERSPSPLWPTQAPTPTPSPHASASPTPGGAWPTGGETPPAPSAAPAPDVTVPPLADPRSETPTRTSPATTTRAAPVSEPAPDPTPSAGPPRRLSAPSTSHTDAAAEAGTRPDATTPRQASGGFLPGREPASLGRAWGGSGDRGVVVVAPGDSLWSLAGEFLGPGADAQDIAAEWPRWYRLNADVIGADPDLLAVGTRLFIPQ